MTSRRAQSKGRGAHKHRTGPVVLTARDGGGPVPAPGRRSGLSQPGVTATTTTRWRDQFLAGGQGYLRGRELGELDEQIGRMKARLARSPLRTNYCGSEPGSVFGQAGAEDDLERPGPDLDGVTGPP